MPSLKSRLAALRAAVWSAVAVVTFPGQAAAQVRAELTPFIGSYYALSPLGLTAANSEERQENQPAIGAVVVVRLKQSLGFEAALAYTPSGTNVTSTTQGNQGLAGRILFASARARLSLPRTNLYFVGGAGIASRGGDAWSGFSELTSVAGVLGFGTQAEVSPKVRIDFKAEVQFYSFDPDGSAGLYESKLQPDVIIGLGIPIALSRRR